MGFVPTPHAQQRGRVTFLKSNVSDALMHDDIDSLELLEKLDLHFETIRFFSKSGNHERVVKELDSLVQMLKPWLE